MDMFVLASFLGFFALVLAWLAAPSGAGQPRAGTEPIAAGAD
jgi:hypothetical protein